MPTEQDQNRFGSLFSEVRYGNVVAKNRTMQLATNSNLDERGMIGPAMIAFHEARARHGVGAIVSPGVAIHPSALGSTSSGRTQFDASSRAISDGFTRLASAIHGYDVPLFGQLVHPGRQHNSRTIPMTWGPSPVPCPYSGGVPHEMTAEDIESVTAGFARAAEILRDCGVDGVEIHGAQGHLLQEFISPFSNLREDEYGGSFVNRMRFLAEVVSAVRAACGEDWVVGVRIAGDEWSPKGIDLAMACEVADFLTTSLHVDYLSLSMGNFTSIEAHIPDRSHAIMAFAPYAAEIRRHAHGVPVVACGRILTPENADQLIAEGSADIIGMTRPLIADERWVEKARTGRAGEVRKCLSCNQCWDNIVNARPVRCVHNPLAGRELELGDEIPVAATSLRIVVVGGGPAGMEAARTSALRGHQVVLFDRNDHLGGQTLIAAKVPGHEELGYVAEYLVGQLQRLDVDIRLGAEATPEEILGLSPDAVVLATGSVPRRDGLPSVTSIPVLTSHDVVGAEIAAGDRVIVLDEDGYFQAGAVAEFLAHRGAKVYIVTRFFEVGREIPLATRRTTLRTLDLLGVELIPNSWIVRSDGQEAVLENYLSKRQFSLPGIDSVVHVGFNKVEDGLDAALRGRVPFVTCVGDAYVPRRILDATAQGHEVARTL